MEDVLIQILGFIVFATLDLFKVKTGRFALVSLIKNNRKRIKRYLHNVLDGRQELCFTTRTRSGYCRSPLQKRLSKKDCCCGVNMGQGWGDDCMRCPIHGEGAVLQISYNKCFYWISILDEHRYLCSGGKGIIGIDHVTITKDGDKIKTPSSIIRINECALRPDICGPGECVDTIDGYECRCKPGYRLLSSNICAGINTLTIYAVKVKSVRKTFLGVSKYVYKTVSKMLTLIYSANVSQ